VLVMRLLLRLLITLSKLISLYGILMHGHCISKCRTNICGEMRSLPSACSLRSHLHRLDISFPVVSTVRGCMACAAHCCCPVGMRYAAQSVEIGLDCVAVLCLGHEMIVQVVLPSLVSCLGCFLKLPLLYCTARM
jgi:hypothetical protein